MKDNRGISLIELIVVMLIMGILAVGSFSAYNLLARGHAKSATERVMALLNYVQAQNLAKSHTYTLVIKADANGNYIANVVSTNAGGISKTELTEHLKLKGGSISFENNHGSLIDVATQDLMISFRKDTGGIKEYSAGNTVTRIIISSSSSSLYIRLVTATGKNYLE